MKKLFAYFVYLFACGVWLFFFVFLAALYSVRDLSSQPEIEPTTPAVKAQSPTGLQGKPQKGFLFFSFFFNLWWILSYIEMKQPWVYIKKERK